MRRPASAVVALPSAYPAEHVRLVPGRARPTGPFAIAFVALIIAAAATQMLTPGRGLPANNSRARASTVLPVTAWGPVSRAIGRDVAAYRATPAGARYLISNAQQRLRAQFSPAGVTVRSGRLVLDVRLRADGYGDALRPLAPVAPAAQANRVFYRHGSLQEWYVNGPLGLEQGFTLSSRPAGHRNGPVTLELSLAGNARAVLSDGGQAVTFSRAGASLAYRGLVATDARGRRLPAWLQLRGRQLLLHVNDTGARYPLVIDPFIQQARLTASDGAAGDGLGSSVAVQGNTIVVGAPFATVNGNTGQGAVYVFVKPRSGWQNATETAKLTASDGTANGWLGGGYSVGNDGVGISGDTIVAGACECILPATGAGALYVFVEPKGGWRDATETAELTASDGVEGDGLGASVAIQGSTIVGGADFATVNGAQSQGAAYVFVEPRGGWRNETEAAKLTAPAAGENSYVGSSVGIWGNTVIAGAPFASATGIAGEGAAYVFVEPRGGWRDETDTAALTPSDGAYADAFGGAVAISYGTVVAGAPNYEWPTDPSNDPAGAVYVFAEPQGGWRSATETAKLTASDGVGGDWLGSSVAIQGNAVIAGAENATVNGSAGEGAVYVFYKPARGWANETDAAKVAASGGAADGSFGQGVWLSGNTLVVGAPYATVGGTLAQGAAYVFAGGWGWPQSVTDSVSPAARIQTRAAVRPARPCTPHVAHDRALTPRIPLRASRNRPKC